MESGEVGMEVIGKEWNMGRGGWVPPGSLTQRAEIRTPNGLIHIGYAKFAHFYTAVC
jgi:hypothetical protein